MGLKSERVGRVFLGIGITMRDFHRFCKKQESIEGVKRWVKEPARILLLTFNKRGVKLPLLVALSDLSFLSRLVTMSALTEIFHGWSTLFTLNKRKKYKIYLDQLDVIWISSRILNVCGEIQIQIHFKNLIYCTSFYYFRLCTSTSHLLQKAFQLSSFQINTIV